MASKLTPTPAGITGTQLDIYDQMDANQQNQQPSVNWRQPAQPIPPVSPIPTPLKSWQKAVSQTDPNVNPLKR